ncbi:conserved hypothetical protein [Beutenbergia cavernae DSM 12333]|uniref:BNR repeat-containing family member n=1 Tax=Beutenbergia cavernae (strain ATCC BAA-8 / DSM 12333 / CCUG 43141 / JCM 11478 / NBRC 16432 / NCIMB 13614 / HKI 0122) TaxID=471853 RepID=C5BVV3_BEUC1|nr:BNR-4 repeat-containing protein [Beutenbergia cavernae]ACQ80554.1 conserved hypothetical protein [Beutenbergia cavernae DSM 12333]
MTSSRVLNDNGAWCWYQDERALVDPVANTLLVGSVAAPEGPDGARRAGNIELSVTDLATGASDVAVLHANLEADDHDTAALLIRPDGRYLAMYTRHKSDDLTRWRISTRPHDASAWEPERTFDWSELTGGRGVTYSNVHRLAAEGRTYAFARAINDDPSILVSDDDGDTWSYGGKLFTRPKVGYVNGYTRYASNGVDRIDVITTDHHPRDYDNSIYHGYVSGGRLHDSSGAVVGPPVRSPDAVSQVELTTVLATGTEVGGARLTHCWTTDLRRDDASGRIAAVLSARADDSPLDDRRLVYAAFDGETWRVHPLARAGRALLDHEQDYTGLAAVDPYDLDSVYVSTPIDPSSGDALAHHEIFHGRTADGGASWAWEAVTSGSSVDNLRPIVAPGDPGTLALLWFRGTMTASQHYDCEVVARVTPR